MAIAVAAALIAIAAIVALTSYVVTHVRLERIMSNDELVFRIRALFGLVKLEFRIPFFRFRGLFDGWEMKLETDKSPKHDKQITPGSVMNAFRKLTDLIKHTADFPKWAKRTLKRVHCAKLHWRTDVGFGDAAETAIATGLVWSLKSSLLGAAFQWVQLDATPELAVQPSYNMPQFSTNFDCILKIRLANAIFAGLLLILSVLKAKGGFRTWQSILFRA